MMGDRHRNDMLELNKFLNTRQYLLGYNSSKYDDIVVKYILSMTYKFKSTREAVSKIKEFSDLVVSQQYNGYDKLVGAINKYKTQFTGIDFMKTMALDKSMKSLKQALINVKFHNIQDYDMPPITEEERKLLYPNKFDVDIQTMKPWDRYVLAEELPNLLAYNYNDVEGLTYLFKTYVSEFILRYNIQIKHGFYALNSSRSDLANRLMAQDYATLSRTSYWDFKDLRTHRRNIHLGSIIDNKVRFKSKELKTLYKNVFSTNVSETSKMGFKFVFDGAQYKMALGGLHSVDRPQVFEPDGYAIRDADVTSFYPNIMLRLKIAPKHLDTVLFLSMLQEYVNTRVDAKHRGDKVTADILKIVINSIYGKLGFEYSFLYDRKAMLQVTINGQFALIMLIEQLAEIGIKTISANTDGIVCKVPPVKEKEYYRVCKAWEKHWELELEYTDYLKYIRRDVNAYITVKRIPYNPDNKKHRKLPVFEDSKGKYVKDIKRKGTLNRNRATDDLAKAFVTPIIAIAIEEYFVNDIPIEDTIYGHKDIYDFCMSQNAGGKFRFERHINRNGKLNIEELQKNLRFYVSTDGGNLYKRSVLERGGDNSLTGIVVGNRVTPFNTYVKKGIEDYKIDYRYYLKEADKWVNVIKYSLNTKRKDNKAYQSYTVSGGGLFGDLI
jgi:hypothetical protein